MAEKKQLKIEFKDVESLLLDDDNPRLSAISDANSQDKLVQVLWDEMAVSEVALSIAANIRGILSLGARKSKLSMRIGMKYRKPLWGVAVCVSFPLIPPPPALWAGAWRTPVRKEPHKISGSRVVPASQGTRPRDDGGGEREG